jgi:hypothetical protein
MRPAVFLILLASCAGGQDRTLATVSDGAELYMPPAFTRDGRHVAYIERTGKDYRVVRGAWKSRRLDAI